MFSESGTTFSLSPAECALKCCSRPFGKAQREWSLGDIPPDEGAGWGGRAQAPAGGCWALKDQAGTQRESVAKYGFQAAFPLSLRR